MRRFSLTIAASNAAFDPDPMPELARILRDLADHLEGMEQGYPLGHVRDVNGNRVGDWSLGVPLGRD